VSVGQRDDAVRQKISLVVQKRATDLREFARGDLVAHRSELWKLACRREAPGV